MLSNIGFQKQQMSDFRVAHMFNMVLGLDKDEPCVAEVASEDQVEQHRQLVTKTVQVVGDSDFVQFLADPPLSDSPKETLRSILRVSSSPDRLSAPISKSSNVSLSTNTATKSLRAHRKSSAPDIQVPQASMLVKAMLDVERCNTQSESAQRQGRVQFENLKPESNRIKIARHRAFERAASI